MLHLHTLLSAQYLNLNSVASSKRGRGMKLTETKRWHTKIWSQMSVCATLRWHKNLTIWGREGSCPSTKYDAKVFTSTYDPLVLRLIPTLDTVNTHIKKESEREKEKRKRGNLACSSTDNLHILCNVTVTATVTARTTFMVLSSWQCTLLVCESSAGSFDERSTSAGQPPTFGPKGNQLEPQIHLKWLLQYYTHHRHLLLLSQKADTHFTITRRVEGWVDLAGWHRTEMPDGARRQSPI